MEQRLYILIEDTLKQFGTETIKSVRLANILLDNRGFSNHKEYLPLLRGLLNNGFGELLFSCEEDHNKDWQVLVDNYLKEYAKGKEQDYDSICYVAKCLIWGIGLNRNESIFLTFQSLEDVGKMYIKAKDDYLELLSSLIKIKEDENGGQTAYYDIDASNRLYDLESKIYVLGLQLGESTSWCEEKKKEVLIRNTKKGTGRKNVFTPPVPPTATKSSVPSGSQSQVQPKAKKQSLFDKITNFFK